MGEHAPKLRAVDAQNRPRPKRCARRGSVTLACAVAAFVVFQLCTSFVADYLEPGIRESEYGRKLASLKTQLQQSPHRPLALLLGTSRTAYGISPEALFDSQSREAPLVFNFGILGNGPVRQLVYFRRLLAAGIRPCWLVLEIHPAFLKTTAEISPAQIPLLEHCDARDLCAIQPYLDQPYLAYANWFRCRAAASYLFRGELMGRLSPRWTPVSGDVAALQTMTPLGWSPGPWPRLSDDERRMLASKGRSCFAPSYQHYELGDRENRALREILATCRREQIATTLLLMPESEELRDGEANRAQQEILRYVKRLGREYRVRVLDASRWCDNADFFDGQHLLCEAAVRLSKRLGREFLSDWHIASSPQPFNASPISAIASGADGSQTVVATFIDEKGVSLVRPASVKAKPSPPKSGDGAH